MGTKPPLAQDDLTLIGWCEYVDLPDWGLSRIKAKADTGARSSSIDVAHLEELDGNRARFEVVADRSLEGARRTVEAAIVRQTKVKSSFGDARDRIFVEVAVTLAGRTFTTEVGLLCRQNMICRMLLGRRTLANQFVVEPARRYLHGRRRSIKKKTTRRSSQ